MGAARFAARIASGLGLIVAASVCQAAGEAEIISLIGKGERRDAEAAPWAPAAVKHVVRPGGFARTLANSRMGLLMPDRNQFQLNQNSQVQIKSAAEAAEFKGAAIRLNAGRAWSQARPQPAPPGSAPVTGARLEVETPSATMSIRGTEWEVEVLPDGSTQVSVVSGSVEMANSHGTLLLGPGEGGIAAPGRAPARLQLINPKARVQWVSSWVPQPQRWAGTERGPGASAASAADQRLAEGEIDAAIALLEPHAGSHAGALALLARALARADRVAEGRQRLQAAPAALAGQTEPLLAAGELAILDGDPAAARAAFRRVLETQPESPEAWFGLGLIEAERENVSEARSTLDRAIAARPGYASAEAERAAVETFAGNLAEARRRLDELLGRQPDNYLALTALGINLLKQGRSADALEAFLKAGTIEPRYARAWLFSGVAFYRLGERARAMEAFRRAAALDPRDPLPHFLESMAIADTLDYRAAIDAAQRARELMPYLKSLNALALDQKGSANLGGALASFGMEDWATWYAREAYSPFWAGSHLFLADRSSGRFNKNSELMKGFITDPTVFGASNRDSTLVAAPGHYGKLEAVLDRAQWTQTSAIGTFNGLVVEPTTLAYFVSGDLSHSRSRQDPSRADGANLTLGLGLKPRHELGLFGYASHLDIHADTRSGAAPNARRVLVSDTRADFGVNYKLAAQNQVWLKAGTGRTPTDASGDVVSALLGPGRLDRYHTVTEQTDLQFRHSFGDDERTLSWGLEQSRLRRPGEFIATIAGFRLLFTQDQTARQTDLYVSLRQRVSSALSVTGDLWLQRARVERNDLNEIDITPPPVPILVQRTARAQSHNELNPRLGASWHFAPGLDNSSGTLRVVGQRWRRPASAGTLGPIDTEGVPVNDRLPMAGGLYQRARAQLDYEAPGRWFASAFVDRERIDNGVGGIRAIVPSLDLGQLEALRVKRDVFSAVADLEETPQFVEGRVASVGLAGNMLVGRNQSLALRYLGRDNRQTGAGTGLRIPYVPRHYLRASSQWTLPERWLAGVSATYRSERFRDDLNSPAQRVKAGWAFGLTAYWESSDKRHSVQGLLDNLLSDKAAGVDNRSRLTARYAYRF